MINLFRKKGSQKGAATLVTAIILILTSTLIVLFGANYGRMQGLISANLNRNSQAYQAAEAGIEFGINYLRQNSTTILANPVSGLIAPYSNASTTNVTFGNNSKFTVIYTNPIANNYRLVRIQSTGFSDDNSSSKVINQLVQFGSLLTNPPSVSVVSKGPVNISGNGEVINTTSNQTIQSAGTVTISGSGETTTATGGSSPGNIGSDIQQNLSSLSSMTQDDFFASYFGTTSTATVQASVAHAYTNSTSTNYSSTLDGMNGTSIFITQTGGSTASISGNTTIGTAANPVLLIVNGSFDITGNVTIYGFIFVLGTSGMTTTLAGNLQIIGGMANADNLNMSGNSSLTYDATVLSNLQNNTGMSYWAKVPGSWRDF